MDTNWLLEIEDHEEKIYSQAGQDGVLEFIFEKLGDEIKNDTPFCVEFGFNADTLEGGSGSNVANLILNNGWNGLLLDSDYENLDINLHKHYLTSDNICEIFKSYNVPKEPEYISIDVDSTDLWLFKSVLSKYNPMVISVEYNPHFPITRAITIDNDTNIAVSKLRGREKRRVYGASLLAMDMVGKEFGYSLAYVAKGLDSFFIRNDLIKHCYIPCIDYFKMKTFINVHRRQKNKSIIESFLDYKVYVDTKGDVEKSKKAAWGICKKCIFKRVKKNDRYKYE